MTMPFLPPPIDRRFADPIGLRLMPVEPLFDVDSVARASRRLGEEGWPGLPVMRDGHVIGVFTEASLRMALIRDVPNLAPIAGLVQPAPPCLPVTATGAEALRAFADAGVDWLIVTDPTGNPLGVLRAGDLYGRPRPVDRPRSVGGMATPFGVYLTSGTLGAGANFGALMATGALMFLSLFMAHVASIHVLDLRWFLTWSPSWREIALSTLTTLGFLLCLRLLPLAGTHAAEHMVVHAIEREEPLVPEVIARMPRVHPRCGTNLAAGAMIFLGISQSTVITDESLRFLAAVVLTLSFWRPLGSFLQTWFTTRTPNARQIANGIQAGEALLAAYARTPYVPSSIWRRLWNSGLAGVISGSLLASLVLELFSRFVPGFQGLRVYL